MRRHWLGSTAIILALVLSSTGCKRADKAQKPASSADANAGKVPANVDQKLFEELAELTKICKVELRDNTLSCAQGEQRRLVSEFVSQQRDRAKAVPTFTAAISDQKPELRAVGANILYSAFRAPWGGASVQAGAVSPADADALLAATLKLPKAQAVQALPAAVHASMLADRGNALMAALDKSGDAQLRTTAVRHLMTHGRLNAFPKIQELAKVQDLQLVLAALESPTNMYDWTPAEQAAVCPWAASFLGDARAPVAAKAGAVLGNCGGEQVDQLIEAGEAALKAGDFSSARVGAFRDLCAPHRRARPGGASDDQCARARKLLDSVVGTKSLTDQARVTALAALAYQWPDADTLKLAKKLEKDRNQGLAESAGRTAARLEQRLQGATPATAKSAVADDKAKPALARVATSAAKPLAPVSRAPTAPARVEVSADNPF
jgi:hypothetical protein